MSSFLFNLYAKHIIRNVGLDELQAGIMTTGRFINKYADDTTLMIENEEELNNFLMRVKDKGEKVGLKLNIKKLRSRHPAPLLHGKWKEQRPK